MFSDLKLGRRTSKTPLCKPRTGLACRSPISEPLSRYAGSMAASHCEVSFPFRRAASSGLSDFHTFFTLPPLSRSRWRSIRLESYATRRNNVQNTLDVNSYRPELLVVVKCWGHLRIALLHERQPNPHLPQRRSILAILQLKGPPINKGQRLL